VGTISVDFVRALPGVEAHSNIHSLYHREHQHIISYYGSSVSGYHLSRWMQSLGADSVSRRMRESFAKGIGDESVIAAIQRGRTCTHTVTSTAM
jgi:hypothetical protein